MVTMEIEYSFERFLHKLFTPTTSSVKTTTAKRNGFISHPTAKDGFTGIPKDVWKDNSDNISQKEVTNPHQAVNLNGISVKYSKDDDSNYGAVTQSITTIDSEDDDDNRKTSKLVSEEETLDEYYANQEDVDENDKFVLVDLEVLLRKGHQAEDGFACRRIVDRQDSFVHINSWSRYPCCNTETIYLQGYREKPSTLSFMDISSGHMILEYMEGHLMNSGRLNEEWNELSRYQPEFVSIQAAEENQDKNDSLDNVPYDHSRVVLRSANNNSESTYINASYILDHDPGKPVYIAAHHPLPDTVSHFWQMIWEQNVVVIVNLTSVDEYEKSSCHRYWPIQGSDLYNIYEVHLVSEHRWCNEYIVRSFYVHDVISDETRTLTQYHYLCWPNHSLPMSTESILSFRKNVNKSYKGICCPVVVHCSDGCGRTGTYCLLDLTLTRIAKGAKEIDIAATLEHFRDQRMNMVSSKEQFDFVLSSIATDVLTVLRTRPK